MIYEQKSKVFRKFLRALTADELVMQTARIFTERQAAKFYHNEPCEKEATRMKRIEETQWSSWEEDKPQLHMDAYDLRQQRLAQSQAQTDSDPSGSTWQMSKEDRKEKIQKGKRILREHRETLALLLMWEIGKPWRLACADFDRCVDGIDWYLVNIESGPPPDSWTPLTGRIAPARRSVFHVHDASVYA